MGRKTIEVHTLLNMANAALSTKDSTADGREAMCAMIEKVLLNTSNYAGYRYLTTNEIAGSGTRRYYFASAALQDHADAMQVQSNLDTIET